MEKFSLNLLFHIVGIGSASGLFYTPGNVFLVSDNGGFLYEYSIDDKKLAKTRLLESDVLENIPKKIKPDFEALAQKDGKLYIFGSGSTPARCVLKIVDLESKHIETADLSPLYKKMQTVSNIDAENFNLEGAVWDGNDWLLLQRGNGSSNSNGVFRIHASLENLSEITFTPVTLPKIKHVPTSFTDAVIVGGSLWFLSSAEDTASTYEDGEVLGSMIGRLDLGTMTVTYSQQITYVHKFEGIALKSVGSDKIVFLLCEDNDSDLLESGIFELTVQL